MPINKIARIGISATALALPATALVAVQPAAAVDSCKTQLQVAVSSYQEATVVKNAFKVRKQALADNKVKRAQQLSNIAKLSIPTKFKKIAVDATKAEYAALAGWYNIDFAAVSATAGLVDDYVLLGNKTQCPTAADKVTAAGYIATAQSAVQTNLQNFQSTAETIVPTYIKALVVAAKKFNNSKIGLKSVKQLIKDVKQATKNLEAQAISLAQIKANDEAVTQQLQTQLTTSPFAPQP